MDTYTNEQFKEILAAKRKNLNLDRILNVDLTPQQMREIRLGEIAGIDTSLYASKDISAEKMRQTRKFMIKGIPINKQQITQYNESQLNEIRLGEKFGINTEDYSSPLFTARQMKSMRLLLVANRIIEYLKDKSISVIHRLEDSVSRTQVTTQPSASNTQQSKAAEPTKADMDKKAEKVQNIIINTLETMDLSKFENIESLSQAIGELLKNDKVLETLSTENQMNEEPHGTYEILKTVTINDDSFAIVRNAETNQFYTVKDYNDVSEESATWNIEKEFSCYEDANKSIGNKIMETKETAEVQANIVIEENPVTREDLENEGIQENLDKDESLSNEKSKTHSHKEVKEEITLTKESKVNELLKLSFHKDAEIRCQVASHENTSPSVLSRLVSDVSQKVALTALQNKNIPTGTLKGVIADEKNSKELKEQALNTLNDRNDNINIEVPIDSSCILKEITSKSKELGMLTIVKIPSNEQIGNHATIIIPSFAIKDTTNGKSMSLVENRKYELRINAKESMMIEGKSLRNYFIDGKQKPLTLNERIENAKDKQIKEAKKENKNLEKNKER